MAGQSYFMVDLRLVVYVFCLCLVSVVRRTVPSDYPFPMDGSREQ